MASLDLSKVEMNRELLTNYLTIAGKNPALVAMAHFQRASQALPPPFFYGPVNQIPRDPMIPLGEGTNTALQTNPGLLHPSIDEPSVDKAPKILLVLEFFAQASIFVVNQASWFWGWGGFWLWPILLYVLIEYRRRGLRIKASVLGNIALLHTLLLIVSSPLPRYVMVTIQLGFLFLTITLSKIYVGFSRRE
jgi:hypothetical protein